MGSGLLAALATLAGPMVARVLLALGMSVVTIGGVAIAVTQVKNQMVSSMSTGPLAALQLAGLFGVWEGLGMLFGAMTFCVSLWALTKATSIVGRA